MDGIRVEGGIGPAEGFFLLEKGEIEGIAGRMRMVGMMSLRGVGKDEEEVVNTLVVVSG